MTKSSLFLFLCLIRLFSWGQGARYIVQNYSLMDELSLNGSVWSVVQDTNGLLFFGSDNGVVVYDGVYWDLVSGDQSTIRSLFLDSDHRICYGGVNDFGFILHNPIRGFYFSSLAAALPDSLRLCGDIWSVSECSDRLFFQSRNRIFILYGGELRAFRVTDCYHRGFVAGDRYIVNQNGSGLTFFDGDGFSPVPGGVFFGDKTISCVIHLPSGKILTGTRSDGVFEFDPVTGMVSEPFTGHPETNESLMRNQLYHGSILPGGDLALATLYQGTLIVSPEGRVLKKLDRQHGLRDNVHYALGLGYDNSLWICTSNGISAYSTHSPFIYWDYTSGIDGVILDIQGFGEQMYIGSLTGLYEVPGGNSGGELYQTGIRKILDSEVWDITPVTHGSWKGLFIGTGTGLYSLQDRGPVLERPGGIVLKVLQIQQDPGYILAMRSEDLDLYRWDGRRFRYSVTVNGVYSGLRTVAPDANGILWIGTRGAEVVQIPVADLIELAENETTGERAVISFNGTVKTYRYDVLLTDVFAYDGEIILSNNNGLLQYNYSSGSFGPCFLFGPAIAGYKKMITSLSRDSHRNIWVGGEDLFLFHPDGTYTVDKLHFQQPRDIFSAFVFFHDSHQRTWIGGNNGVYLYDSQIETRFPSRLRTVINRILFDNDSTRILVNAGMLKPEATGEEENLDAFHPLAINLTRRNSQVTFYYALPYFESENRTLYSYRLEGYSDDWSTWSDATRVTFSNLRPARYTFQVRASTIYEQVAQPASVEFLVPQPWYTSRGGIIVYFLLLSLLVYLIAHRISVVKVRKQLRIEDIIQKRIQETRLATILSSMQPNHVVMNTKDASPELQALASQEQIPSGQAFINKALKILEQNMSDPDFSVIQFCREMGMSQARAYRKMIALTGMSITKFIRNIRLKKAAELLLETDLSISEVAYQTGFSNPGYFTKCFKEEFGKNPRDVAQNKKHIHL